jgi:hypothetical protein
MNRGRCKIGVRCGKDRRCSKLLRYPSSGLYMGKLVKRLSNSEDEVTHISPQPQPVKPSQSVERQTRGEFILDITLIWHTRVTRPFQRDKPRIDDRNNQHLKHQLRQFRFVSCQQCQNSSYLPTSRQSSNRHSRCVNSQLSRMVKYPPQSCPGVLKWNRMRKLRRQPIIDIENQTPYSLTRLSTPRLITLQISNNETTSMVVYVSR